MVQLGILEFGKSMENISDEQIIGHTIDYAQLAEANGYSKFWLAEHHDQDIAWRSPEVLMAIIAGYTETINIGAGGILLPLNSPLRVAHHFKMLSTLFPGRIDLGIGKGTTSHAHISDQLLNGLSSSSTVKDHDQRLELLLQFLQDQTVLAEREYFGTPPFSGKLPTVWVLGTSGSSADVLIKNKCAFSFSIMHTMKQSVDERAVLFNDIIKKYEDVNSQKLKRNLAVSVIAGESQAETDAIKNKHEGGMDINICGKPGECIEQINALADKFNVEEVLINFISNSVQNKSFCIQSFARENKMAKPVSL